MCAVEGKNRKGWFFEDHRSMMSRPWQCCVPVVKSFQPQTQSLIPSGSTAGNATLPCCLHICLLSTPFHRHCVLRWRLFPYPSNSQQFNCRERLRRALSSVRIRFKRIRVLSTSFPQALCLSLEVASYRIRRILSSSTAENVYGSQ